MNKELMKEANNNRRKKICAEEQIRIGRQWSCLDVPGLPME